LQVARTYARAADAVFICPTNCVARAAVRIVGIEIRANAMAQREWREALARIGAGSIGTRRGREAIIHARGAFVDIGTRDAIAGITRGTRTRERPRGIGTRRGRGAIVRVLGAFIDVEAETTIADVARFAHARERTGRIGAGSIGIAIVGIVGAFVDVATRHAIAAVTRVAKASEGSRRIDARRIRIAIVGIQGAFIDIDAGRAVAHIAGIASESARSTAASALSVVHIGARIAAHAAIPEIRLQIDAARSAQRRRSGRASIDAAISTRFRIGCAIGGRRRARRPRRATIASGIDIRFATIGGILIAIGITRRATRDDANPGFTTHGSRVDIGQVRAIVSARSAIGRILLRIRANPIAFLFARSAAPGAALAAGC